jgi:uncharacterized protein with ParB-like and HNH nuclease domain
MQNLKINNTLYPITSKFSTLSKIVEEKSLFNIPIYQRLYVWGDEQIKTLLEDLNKGFKDSIEHYYLGGVMLSYNEEGKYDLIDGQQRFTTLWLIGHVLKGKLVPFNYSTEFNNRKSRLSFSIRDYANDFFSNPEDFKNTPKYAIENLAELVPIEKAIQTIERFFTDNKIDDVAKLKFSQFIMEKVLLMVTEMPKNTDENKLFEVLNNRGIQLQHHEILKARMLRHIADDKERSKYAKLWDACSIMDEYIEKNIKEVSDLKWKDLTFQPDETEKVVDLPSDILDRITAIEAENKVHLLQVLTSSKIESNINTNANKEPDIEYNSGKVESIISFPMLLLHVLRIYQFDKDKLISDDKIAIVDEKKLLQIFDSCFKSYWDIPENKETVEENVKAFFRLLWSIRIGFDNYIIKWIIKDNNLKIHGVKKLYLNKDALQRKESDKNDGFALLQSMLYHSQQIITHYWLTPLLNKVRTSDNADDLYKYLMLVDNSMFCSGNTEGLSPRSWHLMNKDLSTVKSNVDHLDIENHRGTDYPSYFFYKLDFVLWHFREYLFINNQLKETRKEVWESYRMTAKNSVEHISPQTRKETDINLVWDENDNEEDKKKKLNDFGNLVLLISNMNSEYSNNIYTTKRSEFLAKANNKRLDSLKSALIFENSSWSWEICEKHRNAMKEIMTKYFNEITL